MKSYDLTWLLHLVGDIHQPLHGSTRVTQSKRGRDGDDGGNEVTVCRDPTCTKTGTLHGLWDESLGSNESLRATAAVGRALPPANATDAASLDPAAWANESLELSKTMVYRLPIGPGNGPYKVDDAYENNRLAVARERAALAAARLAAVLNANVK